MVLEKSTVAYPASRLHPEERSTITTTENPRHKKSFFATEDSGFMVYLSKDYGFVENIDGQIPYK
jgi:hypothetical protein